MEAVLALVIVVAHRTEEVADAWVAGLVGRGHMAQRIDPTDLPERPSVLDAMLVDSACSAQVVEDLKRWGGASVALHLSEAPPDDDWLAELVRTASPPLVLGDLHVDLRRGMLQRGDDLVALTDTEALLLAWLASRAGAVVSRGDLLKNVWGYSPNMRTRVVDVTVARLRSKVEQDPANPTRIMTVRGKGYRLDGVVVAAPSPEVPSAPPRSDSGLVGRQPAWERLHQWLDGGDRVFTLLGPPGIGKTALASAFQNAVPGALFCGLQRATTEDEAASVLGEVLGLTGGVRQEAVERAVRFGERPLLVLDNAEHLLGWVRGLLEHVPASPVLVTSRVRIGVPEERCLDLEPLDADQTQALFLSRARELRPDFAGEPRDLAALASLCEGLPLAVELAAAQVHVLSAPDLVRVLSRRDVKAPRRSGHKSYDEALTSSWALLDGEEQQLLSVLAAVRGDAPLSLVESVFEEPLEALSGLVDASLVRMHHTEGGAVAHLLTTVRRHVLRTAPLDVDSRRALVLDVTRHVTHLAERSRGVGGWAAVRDLGRLRPAIWGAVESALELNEAEAAARMGVSLAHFYETIGPDAPDLAMLQRVAADTSIPSAFDVAHLRTLVLSRSGRPDEAKRQAARAAELANTPAQRAQSVYVDTMLSLRDRDADPAPLAAVLDDLDDVGRYRALGCLAVLDKIQLKLDDAIARFEAALAIADRTGAGWMETNVLGLLASVYGNAGQWERAAATADALVDKLDAAGFSRSSELSLQLQRLTRQGLGDLPGAIALQRELIALMGARGQLWHQGRLSTALAGMYLDVADSEAAVESAREAIRRFRAAEDDTGVGHATAMLAAAMLARGESVEARRLAEPQLSNRESEARDIAMEVMLYTAVAEGDPAGAASALERTETSAALRQLVEAVLAALSGMQVDAPPRQAGRFGHRGALGSLLGGPTHEPRSDRERAILSGASEGYPESALVRALHARLAGS